MLVCAGRLWGVEFPFLKHTKCVMFVLWDVVYRCRLYNESSSPTNPGPSRIIYHNEARNPTMGGNTNRLPPNPNRFTIRPPNQRVRLVSYVVRSVCSWRQFHPEFLRTILMRPPPPFLFLDMSDSSSVLVCTACACLVRRDRGVYSHPLFARSAVSQRVVPARLVVAPIVLLSSYPCACFPTCVVARRAPFPPAAPTSQITHAPPHFLMRA